MKLLTSQSLYLLFLTTTTYAWAQSDNLFTEPGREAARTSRASRDSRATRSRAARINTRVLNETATLNLFPGAEFEVRRLRSYESASGEGGIWSGEIVNDAGSEVILAVREGMVSGSVRTAGGDFFRIRPTEDGSHLIEQLDPHLVPIDDEAPEPPADLLTPLEEGKNSGERAAVSVARDATLSTIDLLVVYTAEARAAAGGATQIRNLIDLAVAEANQSFVSSGISISVRVVHAAEAAPSTSQAASSTYLSNVSRDAGIVALRDRYGADMVSAWVSGPGASGGTVGIGWVMSAASVNFARSAFSVVEANFAAGPSYSFTHELGHNLGSLHDRANSGGAAAYPYAYGYQQPNGAAAERFVTIMAYRNGCAGCPRINQWSNPDVNYAGRPTGIAATQPDAADNRQTLNNTRTFAEQWRTAVGTPPPAPPPAVAPAVTSVSPSAGTGTDAVFTALFSDSNGGATIGEAHVSITSGTQTSSVCTVVYRASTGALWLRDDAGTGWAGFAAAGTSTLMQNGQCRVSAASAAVSVSGNALSVRFPVTFLGAFAGTKDLLLRAIDSGGLESGSQRVGSWTIPQAAPPPPPPATTAVAPVPVSVSPATGQGNSATFTAIVQDANGAAEISTVNFIVHDRLTAARGCYVLVMPRTRVVYLLNDGGTGWSAPVTAGQAVTLSNSQCSVDVSRVTLDSNGTRMTVTYPLRFTTSFAGAKSIYLSAADTGGRFGQWIRAAAFTVQ